MEARRNGGLPSGSVPVAVGDRVAGGWRGATALLPAEQPAVQALRAAPRCALVFQLRDLEERGEPLRCLQINCRAVLLTSGPVYDHLWWRQAVSSGTTEGCVAVHFHHESTYDTRCGGLEEM